MNEEKDNWQKAHLPGLVALSLAALASQVLMVRIFSYTMNHGFVYMAVSLAMLGFGLSGTVLTLFRSLKEKPVGVMLQICCLGFALSLCGTMILFGQFASSASPDSGLSILSPLAGKLLALTIPFVFAGLGIGLSLLATKKKVGVRYAWNLAGSGLGCLLAYPILSFLGADGGIFLVAGLTAGAAIFCGPKIGRIIAGIVALALLSQIPLAKERFAFAPDSADQLADLVRQMEKDGHKQSDLTLEYEAWDPVGRIEVHGLPGEYGLMKHQAPLRFYSQDAGAGSVLLSLDEHPELKESLSKGTLYGLASRLRPHARALVIGIGGAPDLIAILATDARQLDAVEINGATVNMVGHEQAEFLGLEDELKSQRLRLHHADGRGFVRSHKSSFDVIQMTGADTYAANPAGASILSEGYLYTTEAFHDYFQALTEDGVLAVTRFGIESARVFNTAYKALEELGKEAPRDHLAVVAQGSGEFWSTVLMSKRPFSEADIKRLYELCREGAPYAEQCWIPAYNAVGFRFDSPLQVTFQGQLPIDLPSMRKKLEGNEWNLEPVSDDRPFFFQFKKRDGIGWSEILSPKSFNKHHWDLPDYLRIAVQVSAVALLLILLPLLKLGFGQAGLKESASTGLGFVALGAGFMFLEVVLMQRCTLFLGHPNHAIVIVLFALLLFSGLGSLVSSKLGRFPVSVVLFAVVGILVWIWLFSTYSQAWFEQRLMGTLLERSFELLIWLGPLGFILGMPFPTFLSLVEEKRPSLSGWAWGANSFASVCASLVAIPVSMKTGFSFSFELAMVCYLVALVAFGGFCRSSRRSLVV